MSNELKESQAWHQRLVKHAKEKLGDKSVSLVFDAAWTAFIAMMIYLLHEISGVALALLSVFLFLGIASGMIIVKQLIADFRRPLSPQQPDKTVETELSHRKDVSSFLKSLMDKADIAETPEQTDDWLLEIEYSITPLFPAGDLQEFHSLFKGRDLNPHQKRRLCVAWLKAERLKLWVYETEMVGSIPGTKSPK